MSELVEGGEERRCKVFINPPVVVRPGGLIITVLSLGLTPQGIPQQMSIMISPPIIVTNPPSVIFIPQQPSIMISPPTVCNFHLVMV